MYPRTEYEMSQADLDRILDACKPVPYIVIGGAPPSSQQENSNRAWAELGSRMGFDAWTVQPIDGKGMRFFSAVPSETESERQLRVNTKAAEERATKIEALKHEIEIRQQELAELNA